MFRMSISGDPQQSTIQLTGRKPAKPWLLPTITGVAGLLAGAGLVGGVWFLSSAAGEAQSQSSSEARLTAAAKKCDLTDSQDAQISDKGRTLTVNGMGEEDSHGLSIDEEACLLRELKAPNAVTSHIDQTTSLDGRQTETWGGVTFAWSYHPDRGLDGVFTLASK